MDRYAIIIAFEAGINIVQAAKEFQIHELIGILEIFGAYELFDWKEEAAADWWANDQGSKGNTIFSFDIGDDSFHIVSCIPKIVPLVKYALDKFDLDYETL